VKVKYLAGALALPLVLAACGSSDDAAYDVSGTVKSKQIDYDCTKKSHAMSLVLGKGTGGSSGGRGGSSGSKSGSSSRGGSSGSKNGGSSSTQNKPPAPVAVPDLPQSPASKSPAAKPKGVSCSTEYELFIENKDGLFEQDVTSEHYERCAEKEKFPSCTKEK